MNARTMLTIILVALLTLIGYAPAQRVALTTPIASTQPARVVYTCYLTGGRTHDVGYPRIVQVEPQWYGDKVGALLSIEAAAMMDFEPAGQFIYTMRPGLLSRTTSKAAIAELSELISGNREWCARLRADAPTRRIISFSNFPIGGGWQYGRDQRGYVADNRRIVNAGAFDFADAIAIHGYLSGDDIHWMRPVDAADYTRVRIEAARVAAKPIVLVLSQQYTDHGGDVPLPILAAQYQVAIEGNVDVCWWLGNVDAVDAPRYAADLDPIMAGGRQ